MKFKNIIKKLPGIGIINKCRKDVDFYKDYRFFKNNYLYSGNYTTNKINYELLLEIHKLEKGFSAVNARVFGEEKVKEIIRLLKIFDSNNYIHNYEYNLAIASLKEYINFFEKNGWTNEKQYFFVEDFLKNVKCDIEDYPVGSFDYYKKDLAKFDFEAFLKNRHSIRNYAPIQLKDEDVKKAVEIANLTPTACNRQMCKVYNLKSNKSKSIIEKYALGLGLFDLSNVNYFLITFDMNAFSFVGERNQGWFNSGLYTMNFINALHSLGIASCCVQFGNSYKEEDIIKNNLNISKNERIAIIIACGYYDDVSKIPISHRKSVNDTYCER